MLSMPSHAVAPPPLARHVVATNLHADLLSDLAAALSGSLGIAPTPPHPLAPYPSCSAIPARFDIHGKASPTRSRRSGRSLFSQLGEKEPAARLMRYRSGNGEPSIRPTSAARQRRRVTEAVARPLCFSLRAGFSTTFGGGSLLARTANR